MSREKIGLMSTGMDTMVVMSEGNPGALSVLAELMKSDELAMIDILHLDDMNIRGWQIWVGYKDHCGEDLSKFRQCIKDRDEGMVETINKKAAQMEDSELAVQQGASFTR